MKNDYLAFNAYNIKKLIETKLAESKEFTDFIFKNSSLNVLIDIFAYFYQTIMFYLNQTSSEVNFVDTELYQNINKLVKILDYNPRGYKTCYVNAQIKGYNSDILKILPKYTRVRVSNKTDNRGYPIYYSTVDYKYINNTVKDIKLYNGIWKLLPTTFIASGIDFETFTLNIYSDSDEQKYVAFPFIDVFVKRRINNSISWLKFTPIETGLFLNDIKTLSMLKPTDNVFRLRLNENKSITITFGNNIYGSRLLSGDEIYIAYLEANGPEAKLAPGELSESSTKRYTTYGIVGMDDALFQEIFLDYTQYLSQTEMQDIYFENILESSDAVLEESVEEIKNNAPLLYKTGGTLKNIYDYENYVKMAYSSNIISVKAMNNFEYVSSLYGWLYNLENKFNVKLITPTIFNRYEYRFADACDFNNIYIFVKSRNDVDISFQEIENKLNDVKLLTSEVVILSPIFKYFVICAYNNNYDIKNFDSDYENYIEVLIDRNILVLPETIKAKVISTISNFFNETNFSIGCTVNISELENQLMSIDGVKRIRTIFQDKNDVSKNVIINGLSFGAFSKSIVDGLDFDYVRSDYLLEKFQFPKYLEDFEILSKRIKIITDVPILTTTTIEF